MSAACEPGYEEWCARTEGNDDERGFDAFDDAAERGWRNDMSIEQATDTDPSDTDYFTRPLNQFAPYHLAAMVARIVGEIDRQDKALDEDKERIQNAKALIRGEKPKEATPKKKTRSDKGVPRGPKGKPEGEAVQENGGEA